MSTSAKSGFHHGDLRAAALASALRTLEAGEQFSLRGVARDVGVSAPALYRHFTDRDALEGALATQGMQQLLVRLTPTGAGASPDAAAAPSAGSPDPASPAHLAVAYVEFALDHPALFRVTFGNACDEGNAERVEAVTRIHELLVGTIRAAFPTSDAAALADGCWAFAHGMACLYLDGKLRADSPEARAEHVRATLTALFALHDN